MKIFPKLKCSICGYVPDEEDIQLTDYEIAECDTCGQEDICDLCRFHDVEEVNGEMNIIDKCSCPKCDDTVSPMGRNRKFLLKEELEGC